MRGVYAFYGMYALIAVGSLLLVSLDGFDLETNLSAMLSCLNNTAPGFAQFNVRIEVDRLSAAGEESQRGAEGNGQ